MILILGGARSGKSNKATELARSHDEVIYLATGVPTDGEMENRISRHRQDRPDSWKTIEEPVEVGEVLKRLESEPFSGAVILDCLGFWLSNTMREVELEGPGELEDFVRLKVNEELGQARGADFELLVVSNEVGMGVIPESSSGRKFRDALGRANQVVGRLADSVYLMVAGFPLQLK
ncbi:MAG: bifunctional adenosylcobinamide kinase/adenosylcobinamide-phosphate guanylyltransferase [Candidatus Bipolaricaulia bacterium]